MSDTKILITDAGLAEVINAEQSGTAPVVLSHIAFGTGQYTPTANMTALKSEFKRFESVKGGAIGDNIIHLTLHDNSTDTYTVNEVGVFTESGTLFAVYSQTTPIIQKASESETMLAIDIALKDINADSITVGDTTFILNPATTTKQGVIELATEAEAKAGTDTSRAITPKTLDATIEAHDNVVHRTGSETIAGPKTFTSKILFSSTSGGICQDNDSMAMAVCGGTGYLNGASVYLYGKDSTANAGSFIINANDGTNKSVLFCKPDGTASWNNKNIVLSVNNNIADASGNISITSISSATKATQDGNGNVITDTYATKSYVDTEKAKYLPLAGGNMTGSITFTEDSFVAQNTENSRTIIHGGNAAYKGASLYLDGVGYNTNGLPGAFLLSASLDGTSKMFIGKPDGTLMWSDKNIVRSVNNTNADASGNVSITSVASATKATQDGNGNVIADTYLPVSGGAMTATKAITRDVDDSFLGLHGGAGNGNDGAQLYLCGANHPLTPSRFQLHARNADTDVILQGGTDGVLEWDDKYVLNNSFQMPTDSGAINLTAGTSSAGGAYFRLYGKDHSSGVGQFVLATTDGESTNALVGKPDGTLTWGGKPIATGATSTITYWE